MENRYDISVSGLTAPNDKTKENKALEEAKRQERQRIFRLIDPYLQNMGGRDSEPQMWIMISERDWKALKKRK